MTLGPSLVALALLEGTRGRVAEWIALYGRVPLFYYAVHIAVAHLAGMVIAFVQGGALRRLPIVADPASIPDWYGVTLPGVYVAWAVVVLAMYPACRWFARLKAERRSWWLSYL